jgi:hypothetical protein
VMLDMNMVSGRPHVASEDPTLPPTKYSGVMMPCAALKIQNNGEYVSSSLRITWSLGLQIRIGILQQRT